MKKIIALLGWAFLTAHASAQNAPSTQEITKKIIKSVTSYADAISCSDLDTPTNPKRIVALSPYTNFDDRENAKYAVLWEGDIGCAGGTGTASTNIAIVTVGAGDSFLVDPSQSSPSITFDSLTRYVDKIVGNTRESLTLEGKEHGPNDPMCCPSVKVRFTLQSDAKGNWKLVDQK